MFKRSMRNPVTTILAFALGWTGAGALFIDLKWSAAQEAPGPPREQAKKELRSHVPTEWDTHVQTVADEHPDVAKRPGFLKALAKTRVAPYRFEFASDFPPDELVPGESIPQRMKEELPSRWQIVVAAAYEPTDPELVEWQGYTSDARNPQPSRVAAKWISRGDTMVVVGSRGSNTLYCWLHLVGNNRIWFRVRTEAERNDTYGQGAGAIRQDFIDKERLFRILTGHFEFPFKSVNDFFVVDRHSGQFDGVDVFMGSVESGYKHLRHGRDGEPGDDSKLKWFDSAQVIITDSDPQYLYIAVTLD